MDELKKTVDECKIPPHRIKNIKRKYVRKDGSIVERDYQCKIPRSGRISNAKIIHLKSCLRKYINSLPTEELVAMAEKIIPTDT